MPARIAVVSPFLDKSHGTERIIIEWISRLPEDYEIHLYSQHVVDVDLSRMRWHRIPSIPGPHLLNFLWWFAANHLWRRWDKWVHGLRYDLVYTAGTNCLDADLISVHVVFAQLVLQAKPSLRFVGKPVREWLIALHRKLYYRLVMFLEKWIYTKPGVGLILIANRTATYLRQYYRVGGPLPIVYVGLDHNIFNSQSRLRNRTRVRQEFQLANDAFVLLLIGNDFKNKGLATVIEALGSLPDLPLVLLAVGRDSPSSYEKRIEELGLRDRANFLPPRSDVESFYAAADVYVGPTFDETFGLPPQEAMACGLPVITTTGNGTAEIMTDGVDGLILPDPNDAVGLAARIRLLYENPELRASIGSRAAETASRYTWDRSGEQIRAIFADALRRKERIP